MGLIVSLSLCEFDASQAKDTWWSYRGN